jgi:hypothetical protein
MRTGQVQCNRIKCAIGVFLHIERHRIRTGTSWFETKMGIIRSILQLYLS